MAHPKRVFSIPPCVTDLLFNLIGFLFLLILLANFETTKLENEQLLKDFVISTFSEMTTSKAKSNKETNVVINLIYRETDNVELINMDGKEYDLESFKQLVKETWGRNEMNDVIVALRCDERIKMGFHDKVLAICKRDGHLEHIRQMVKIDNI